MVFSQNGSGLEVKIEHITRLSYTNDHGRHFDADENVANKCKKELAVNQAPGRTIIASKKANASGNGSGTTQNISKQTKGIRSPKHGLQMVMGSWNHMFSIHAFWGTDTFDIF